MTQVKMVKDLSGSTMYSLEMRNHEARTVAQSVTRAGIEGGVLMFVAWAVFVWASYFAG